MDTNMTPVIDTTNTTHVNLNEWWASIRDLGKTLGQNMDHTQDYPGPWS